MFCGPEDFQAVGRMGIMIGLEKRIVCLFPCVCVWYRLGFPHGFESLWAASNSGVCGVALVSDCGPTVRQKNYLIHYMHSCDYYNTKASMESGGKYDFPDIDWDRMLRKWL